MSDSWYGLSLLYNQLPGVISFGNKDYAISYMRRCIDTQDNVNRMNLTNYLELAVQLYDRGWSAEKRAKEADKMERKYNAETVPTEKVKNLTGCPVGMKMPCLTSLRSSGPTLPANV